MSDKKIFIGLSPEEARLVVKACRFTVWKINEQEAKEIEFTTANHAELLEFYERLESAADAQAELAARNRELNDQDPASNNQNPESSIKS